MSRMRRLQNCNRILEFLMIDPQYLFHYQDIDAVLSIERYAPYAHFFGCSEDAIYLLQDYETKQMFILETFT